MKKSNLDKIYTLPLKWRSAAAIGSLWGAMEIIVGSTIHNLMLPLVAGTVLSFTGVLIISAFTVNKPERGLYWRAALICALLKSVSPSAVIIPPMLGIFLEGLLLEVGLLLLGRNIFGMLLGGAFAVSSVLIFKAARLYMMYGATIVDFYQSVVKDLKPFSLLDRPEWFVLLAILVVYMIIGMVAVLFGRLISHRNGFTVNSLGVKEMEEESASGEVDGGAGHILLLFTHLFVLVVLLLLSSSVNRWVFALFCLVYIGIVLMGYPRIRRMIRKPKVFIPIFIFSFLAPLLLTGKFADFTWASRGIALSARAFLVIVAFGAIGAEMAKPSIAAIFGRGIFKPAYVAVGVAFNTLPTYLERLTGTVNSTQKNVFSNFVKLLNNVSETSGEVNPNVFIIVGERAQGKTTFLKNLVEKLNEEKVLTRGFWAEGVGSPNLREAYKLVFSPSAEDQIVCRRVNECGFPAKAFEFDKEVVKMGEEFVLKAASGEIIFLDEIGMLELEGEVWANLLNRLVQQNTNPVIFTCRKANALNVIAHWNLYGAKPFDIDQSSVTDVASEIILKVGKQF